MRKRAETIAGQGEKENGAGEGNRTLVNRSFGGAIGRVLGGGTPGQTKGRLILPLQSKA